ncbi:hypothetical protein MTP99_000198 [Tenebrio molitor]|jgi:hypothetical protein|uniref:Odorant-binding protein 13 mRNA n=1 Tax=Tenebrio molitor TaxID=7067 RepID=A0A0C5B5Y7_TENMO|nr:odorant-binding protein 13 [Tenebrio molitor]KAJ3636678.1 hypothetical protein MTP99_000198 [Tenebrio molitor]CAH1363866.1 unnamed protein product [Tenebrio molitor]
MRHSTLLVLVALVAAVQMQELSNRGVELFKQMYSSCLQKSNVNVTYALETFNGVVENEPKLKEFLFCSNKQNGFQDRRGNLRPDAVRRRLQNNVFIDSQTIETIVSECTERKESPQETAYHFWKCSFKKVTGTA